MRRRDFITGIAGSMAAWPLAVLAQQMPVIGFLNSGGPSGRANFVAAFRRGLREFGFVEGQNVAIEYRWANDQYENLPDLATDLVRRRVNVIAAIGTAAPALAAKAASSAIPIVFQIGSDPIQEGLVASINRPGGKITGTAHFATSLEGKRLGLLHELLPKTAVIAVLINPNSTAAASQLEDLNRASRTLQRQVRVINVAAESELEKAFETINGERVGGLLVSSDALFASQMQRIVVLAGRHSLPAVYSQRAFALVGGMMSYSTDLANAYRDTGVYVGRILKGEDPADLPVLQSTKFEFVINLKTAAGIGISIPSGVLAIVDEVIE